MKCINRKGTVRTGEGTVRAREGIKKKESFNATSSFNKF